jgi:hypothetical protein
MVIETCFGHSRSIRVWRQQTDGQTQRQKTAQRQRSKLTYPKIVYSMFQLLVSHLKMLMVLFLYHRAHRATGTPTAGHKALRRRGPSDDDDLYSVPAFYQYSSFLFNKASICGEKAWGQDFGVFTVWLRVEALTRTWKKTLHGPPTKNGTPPPGHEFRSRR